VKMEVLLTFILFTLCIGFIDCGPSEDSEELVVRAGSLDLLHAVLPTGWTFVLRSCPASYECTYDFPMSGNVSIACRDVDNPQEKMMVMVSTDRSGIAIVFSLMEPEEANSLLDCLQEKGVVYWREWWKHMKNTASEGEQGER